MSDPTKKDIGDLIEGFDNVLKLVDMASKNCVNHVMEKHLIKMHKHASLAVEEFKEKFIN